MNNRVLRFPNGSFSADAVWGQGSSGNGFSTGAQAASATGMFLPTALLFDASSHMYVAGAGNNRVLRFTLT